MSTNLHSQFTFNSPINCKSYGIKNLDKPLVAHSATMLDPKSTVVKFEYHFPTSAHHLPQNLLLLGYTSKVTSNKI